ncbi:hypothetical protein BDY21DRAFT_20407 [Lineolata rhizophorae]|uniref:Uncharacterized protein n=1 Tax=Lineolata rhizophorae TaxID=578093 RepID=A0A6A6P1U5_9PEZI|nr:hypothetical protein BDY21DRAFT_20407 [Lineolata rhizophorae]
MYEERALFSTCLQRSIFSIFLALIFEALISTPLLCAPYQPRGSIIGYESHTRIITCLCRKESLFRYSRRYS